MRTGLLLLVLCLFALQGIAQQGPQLMIPEEDSTEFKADEILLTQPIIESESFKNDYYYKLNSLPLNINQAYFNRYALNPNIFEKPSYTVIPETSFTLASPFYSNGQIFGGSSTSLSENVTVGGYSYGANSVFSAPLPNRQNSQFDTYGSTLFMQYKVSKKFKIETRVSVGQSNQGPPPPPGR